MSPTVEKISALVLSVAFLAYLFWRSFRKADEPWRLVLNWLITVACVAGMFKIGWPITEQGSVAVVAGVLIIAAFAIVIGIAWAPTWGLMLSKPLTNAFDGGDEEPEAKPIYSTAETKRRRNQFHEAIAEIRKQLAKFPNDFSGQLLLAEIQAENLNDLQGAQVTIERIVNQPKHAPANIASALHHLADWHLKFGQDPDSARAALGKILALLPETQFSQVAAQRIAHLASISQLIDSHDRRVIEMGTYEQFIGLRKPLGESKPEPKNNAAELVKHLEQHPLDTDSRERLAVIYAEEYQRVDMAVVELNHLISQPNQPAKRVAHWLNLLAELQLKYGNDMNAARETLLRIPELFPKTAYAQQAQTRIAYLKNETRRNEKSQPVAMQVSSYEKYLGLKPKTNAENSPETKVSSAPQNH